MSVSRQGQTVGALQRFRKFRRRQIKQLGMRLIRGASDFIASQSLVGDAPVLSNDAFPFTAELEKNWKAIRQELDEVLKERELIPAFQQVSPDQKNIAFGDHWKTFIFFGFGYRVDDNCAKCPFTARLLEGAPGLLNAWFSILAPGYHVPPHRGVTKGLVRVHLGLKIPADRTSCYIRVDQEICVWEEGKCITFDDTFEHEVYNNTDEERVVLFLDFKRPMKWPGRLFNDIFLQAITLTGYVQDGRKNLFEWNKKIREKPERLSS